MATNYTQEMTDDIVLQYTHNPSRLTVERLAEKYEKPVKSIIGKLSKEGVYQRQSYVTKTGEQPITKHELVVEIADLFKVSEADLSGLDKAPKATLKKIVELLEVISE